MKRLIASTIAMLLAGCSAEPPSRSDIRPPTSGYDAAGPAYAPGGLNAAARDSMANGNVAAAESGFSQAVDVNPFDPIALNNLAVAKTEAGQFLEAQTLLERAERLAPQNTEVAANLARLRSWNQNYATQDGSIIGEAGGPPSAPKNLPPDPPPLWDTRVNP